MAGNRRDNMEDNNKQNAEEQKKVSIFKVILIYVVILIYAVSIIINILNRVTKNDNVDLSGLPEIIDTIGENNPNFKKYMDEDGTSFSYPKDWVDLGMSIPMFGLPSEAKANVSLVKTIIANGISFSEHMDHYIEFLKEKMTFVEEISKEEINLNGKQTYKLMCEVVENNQVVKVAQVLVLQNEIIYILSVGALSEYYATVEDTLNKIISTFHVITLENKYGNELYTNKFYQSGQQVGDFIAPIIISIGIVYFMWGTLYLRKHNKKMSAKGAIIRVVIVWLVLVLLRSIGAY